MVQLNLDSHMAHIILNTITSLAQKGIDLAFIDANMWFL